jgi:hypothetical protein
MTTNRSYQQTVEESPHGTMGTRRAGLLAAGGR